MKTKFLALGILSVLLICFGTAIAGDLYCEGSNTKSLTGYWSGTYKWTSPGWSATWPIGLGIHVSPQGRITGVIGVYTLGNYGEWSYKVSGRVIGNKIEFVYKGTTHNHLFKGTIEGSKVKGNFERSDGQYGIFEINKYTKNPDDLRHQTGYWEGNYNWDSVGNDTWCWRPSERSQFGHRWFCNFI